MPAQRFPQGCPQGSVPSSARSLPPRRPRPRVLGRLAAVSALALAFATVQTAPAAAHAHVTASEPRALAEKVTLTFESAAENDAAGFTEVRVSLPEGIAPGDVGLGKAPRGWKLKHTKDGYAVAGPELPVGTDAVYEVEVRQLPDAEKLAFRTVETYGDGAVSRWIETPEDGAESEQPAPALDLEPAAPGAKPLRPASSGAAAEETPAPADSATGGETDAGEAGEDAGKSSDGAEKAGRAQQEDEGSAAGPLLAGVAVLLALGGGGAWWLARRRSASSSSGS
ncbi:DUF1775 domain-containing protein [Streptomyces zingiberis]|uniref:DUF1775 domain-containing protein n=1 Tax=Streptomyces zingiberis TaxID=2053010 RepID=A0ABX1C0N6_9ACTN|nr:DUF1775 domain-containing protein [Streptomyces zingiberis]NJQ03480.1 DUF1775 domain-containing protein [Streptomyces zingiberis]